MAWPRAAADGDLSFWDAAPSDWPDRAVVAPLLPLLWLPAPEPSAAHAATGQRWRVSVLVPREEDTEDSGVTGNDGVTVCVAPEDADAPMPDACGDAVSAGTVVVRLADGCVDPLCRAWHAWADAQWRARFPDVADALDAARRGAPAVIRAAALRGFPAAPAALSPFVAAGEDARCCMAATASLGGGHAEAPLSALCAALAGALRHAAESAGFPPCRGGDIL